MAPSNALGHPCHSGSTHKRLLVCLPSKCDFPAKKIRAEKARPMGGATGPGRRAVVFAAVVAVSRTIWTLVQRHWSSGLSLDALILSGWAERRHLMRTQLGWFRRRRAGPYVVQFSPSHTRRKRKAERGDAKVVPVVQAFDPNRFNFSKADPAEAIADIAMCPDGSIRFRARRPRELCPPDGYPSTIFINISPLAPAHSMVVVGLRRGLPQLLTREALATAAAILRQSTRSDMRILYNSMGAWASQNHLHLHIVYLKGSGASASGLPCETIKNRERLTFGCEFCSQYPVNAFRFFGPGAVDRAASFVSRLQAENIAHNVVVSPAVGSGGGSQGGETAIFVFPRKNQCFNQSPVCDGRPLKFAAFEAGGLVLARSNRQFRLLTEEIIEREMRDNVCLSRADLDRLAQGLRRSGSG